LGKSRSFKEQMMLKDKYVSIFLKSNGSYCVYYPSNIFCNTMPSIRYADWTIVIPGRLWIPFDYHSGSQSLLNSEVHNKKTRMAIILNSLLQGL